MLYLTNLNLNKNQIQNAVIHPLASAPANGVEGQIYYNSADKFIYCYDGGAWKPVGVVYSQGSTTGAVITGLDGNGQVTTTNVTGLTLTGYTPVADGYISDGMTLEAAFKALDEAVKNAVSGGGEVNQNAFSNIGVGGTTIAATTKTDTFNVTGEKQVELTADVATKTVKVTHKTSGVTAGVYGDTKKVAKVTVDAEGHVTSAEDVNITLTAADVGADVAGAASDVLGTDADTSTSITVYGARKLAQEAKDAANAAQASADAKVASVTAADKSITVGGTTTAPTVKVAVSAEAGNALSLVEDGLKVAVPSATEYSITKADAAEEGFVATYHLTKDGANVGVAINIPKDYLVKSAEIKESAGDADPSGLPVGTKYIDFVVNTVGGDGNESHIYLNVNELVDAYQAGDGIEIDSATNTISAKVVVGNGLSVDATGIKMALAGAEAGAMSAEDKAKLDGIDTGATANTIVLNGQVEEDPTFFAPIDGGSAGHMLVSGGADAAPVWQAIPQYEHIHKYTENNTELTAVGGAFTWTIAVGAHNITSPAMTVQVYEVATGDMVMPDISIDQTSHTVTITINDTANATTLTAGTYKAVLIG